MYGARGLALAAAVLLKLTPGLLVVFLLARREHRLVGWTVGLGALLSQCACRSRDGDPM
jgi:hypothetical protein